MNIAQANAVPMQDLLAAIGSTPTAEKPRAHYYLSPWRAERAASFHVHLAKNVWYDHGEGIGGDVVAFACTYLERSGKSCSASDGLKWLKDVLGDRSHYVPIVYSASQDNEALASSLTIKKHGPIKHIALIRYIESRMIPLNVAKQLLQEVWVNNEETNKQFFALGFQNEDEGWELRNPFFKGCIRPKTIKFIRGKEVKPDSIHVFEGAMDYLSMISQQKGKPLEGDTIILNSLSCLKHAFPYIRNYGYRIAYSWFDNDAAGEKAKHLFDQFLKTEQDLEHLPMNGIYAPYKDVNEWHIAKLTP